MNQSRLYSSIMSHLPRRWLQKKASLKSPTCLSRMKTGLTTYFCYFFKLLADRFLYAMPFRLKTNQSSDWCDNRPARFDYKNVTMKRQTLSTIYQRLLNNYGEDNHDVREICISILSQLWDKMNHLTHPTHTANETWKKYETIKRS